MPKARKYLVHPADTPYYHVSSRCVRRAYLCGEDHQSGKSYEHRRQWIEDRARILASLFSINLCAYAIMSNHYHLVVKLTPQQTDDWTDDEVLERWTSLFKGPLLIQKYRTGESLSTAELSSVRSIAAVFRQRLSSLSWFMKCLNEPIARMANAEDGCTGHFWEARFHSQALCTERALFTAMAYVDLNPVRAGIASTPEASPHTSIKERMTPKEQRVSLADAVASAIERGELLRFDRTVSDLMAFSDIGTTHGASEILPMQKFEYFKLVDVAGRVAARGKRGRIDTSLKPVLERLGLTDDEWIEASTRFRRQYWRGDLRSTA